MAIDVAQRQPSSSKPDSAACKSHTEMIESLFLMSEEQLKAFLEKVQSDTCHQEKLKADADDNAVIAIDKDAGFSISADDLKNAKSTALSDEELEGEAGGMVVGKYGEQLILRRRIKTGDFE